MKYIYSFLLIFLFTFNSAFAQETYSVNCTTFYVGKYYSTGHPRVKRSLANKKKFLDSLGLKECPKGYEVDHVIPLHQGGTDECDNMQLLTIEEHKRKTIRENKHKKSNEGC